MEYLVGGHKYALSYEGLRCDFERFRAMSDEEFAKPETLLACMHFCCVVGYLKEVGAEATISDQGVIHELIHLSLGIATRPLRDIREQFSQVMRLA